MASPCAVPMVPGAAPRRLVIRGRGSLQAPSLTLAQSLEESKLPEEAIIETLHLQGLRHIRIGLPFLASIRPCTVPFVMPPRIPESQQLEATDLLHMDNGVCVARHEPISQALPNSSNESRPHHATGLFNLQHLLKESLARSATGSHCIMRPNETSPPCHRCCEPSEGLYVYAFLPPRP